ncbi:iron dicitrate transport regulator FecR [Leptospira selangorensis]|uniref:Iron dicitrate transport regulator FecR n=1 Tax=Leptospira selangorensis TaxID=2484982 RepID=A0A4R9GCP2_9LEPT|nr:FecR domain-containing protein [Leptospira selangorensis]TGK09524.1 iron dicitrate transport regulator FecR [Leptospira selangorensis]TGM16254.1 iron dicitrate transport regulator FecR [Leptospira selangorensis]TGM17795.1 iron dicitrate transport regulator FecR [Leptospira selangorensis]
MERMNPEFQTFAELLKKSLPDSKAPDFDPNWVGMSPRFSVEANIMQSPTKDNVVQLSGSKNKVWFLAAAAILFVGIGAGTYFTIFKKEAAPVAEGTLLKAAVVFVKGEAKNVKETPVALHLGDILSEGDKIVTGKGGSIDIGLTDSSVIRLKENSELVLKSLRQTDSSQIRISLMSGKILNLVEKEKKNANYFVDTPTVVAAVRGTSFEVNASDKESSVFVVEGAVEVTPLIHDKSERALITGGLIIVTNEKVIVIEDQKRAKEEGPEYGDMRKNLSGLDKEVLASTQNLKTAKTEQELEELYDKSIEQIIMKDGRELRGVVVSQKKGKLIVQTLKGSYILDENAVEKIIY